MVFRPAVDNFYFFLVRVLIRRRESICIFRFFANKKKIVKKNVKSSGRFELEDLSIPKRALARRWGEDGWWEASPWRTEPGPYTDSTNRTKFGSGRILSSVSTDVRERTARLSWELLSRFFCVYASCVPSSSSYSWVLSCATRFSLSSSPTKLPNSTKRYSILTLFLLLCCW